MNGSSRGAGTTENTSTDLGAETEEAQEISRRSRGFARVAVGDETDEDRIRQRCAIAVGDLGMAELLRFRNKPVDAGLNALGAGAPIYTDIRMIQTGILKKGHASEILCALDFGGDLAKREEITRTSAGFLALGRRLEAAIVVIGNSPSALIAVCRMAGEGIVPALVIGVPVGFVNAAESKELLRTMEISSISTVGTRGGTPVAVAAMNEIITIHAERQKSGIQHG